MSKKALTIPSHIAIIMDGNGRWATKRCLPRNLGHKEGMNAVKRTIQACLDLGVKYCTFFAFSTENWKRSKEEVEGIFNLLRDCLKNDKFDFENKGIKVNSIGELSPFPDDLKETLSSIKEKTSQNDKLVLTLALNYGGRDDLVRAFMKLKYKECITEKDIKENLDTFDLPDPDLIIRTSGEQRISNFLLFQMAYSEFYFTKTYWPDFDKKALIKAIENFSKRDRRFGGIK